MYSVIICTDPDPSLTKQKRKTLISIILFLLKGLDHEIELKNFALGLTLTRNLCGVLILTVISDKIFYFLFCTRLGRKHIGEIVLVGYCVALEYLLCTKTSVSVAMQTKHF